MSPPVRLLGLLVIAALYLGFPNARPDLVRFNAHDAESYLMLSYALTHGLGYTRSLIPDYFVPITVWAPGFPLLLAPIAAFIQPPIDWLMVKLYMICFGFLGMGFTWAYVRRLTNDRMAADIAAMLLGLAPFYWLYSRITMSEVPSIVTVLGILLLVDVVWSARRPTIWQACGVGLIAGLAMLVRGNTLGLMLVPLAYSLGQRKSALAPSRMALSWLAYAALFCVPYLIWLMRNLMMPEKAIGFDGQSQIGGHLVIDPLDPTSRLRTPIEVLGNFIVEVRQKIIYRLPEQMLPGLWVWDWQLWPGAPFLALVLTAMLGWFVFPRGMAVMPVFLVILPHAVLMAIIIQGGSVRYWTPITSLLIVALVVQSSWIWRHWRQTRRSILAVGLLLVYGASTYSFAIRHEASPYYADMGDLVSLYQKARELPIAPGPVLTEHPGLYTLITGWPAPLLVAGRETTPSFHAITIREGGGDHTYRLRAPPGSTELLRVGNWRLIALPRPLTAHEVFTAHDRP